MDDTGNNIAEAKPGIHHMAVYVKDIDAVKAFYEAYFGAKASELYHNVKTGLKTYFLTFNGGARLELMTRPDIYRAEKSQGGYAHIAFGVGSREEVDRITERLRDEGYSVISGPRVTGDGYYESSVLDPEGNPVEIVE